MDNKPWRWKRNKSSEKLFANGGASISVETNFNKEIGDHHGSSDIQSPRCFGTAGVAADRLGLNMCDCCDKDDIIRKHAKMAQLALAGQKTAEAEASMLKQELDKALKQGEVAEQRLAQLDAALKDCMQEIESLGVEQDSRIQEAFSKANDDFNKIQMKLESKLSESNKRVSTLTAENNSLMKALLCKEKLIEDLDRGKGLLEAEFDMLMAKSDLVEKENSLLKYECGVLEEELKLRNDECDQLNRLVRKRMHSNSPRKMSKEGSMVIKRVCELEEENKALREIVSLSDSELESWRIKCSQMDARLAELEVQLRDVLEGGGSSNKEMVVSGGAMDGRDEMDNLATAVTTSGPTQGLGRNESWLDEAMRLILEEQRVSKRSFCDILADLLIVFGFDDGKLRQKEEDHTNITGLLPWKEDPRSDNASDASFSREKIRKNSSLDRSRSETQLDVVSSNSHDTLVQMISIQSSLQEENRTTKEKLELLNKENMVLKKQLEESNRRLECLKREADVLRETKVSMEEQIENQRLVNEDVDTQLTVTRAKLNEITHKVSSLEVELEDKSHCCEELEATCLELQLQLEIFSRKGTPSGEDDQAAKKLNTEMINNSIPSKTTNLATQRSSLRDRMLAEDRDEKPEDEKHGSENDADVHEAIEVNRDDKATLTMVAVVPSKKASGGFGFIRKMFWRRKRGGVNKTVKSSVLVGSKDVLLLT